jgi:hypothetical protein
MPEITQDEVLSGDGTVDNSSNNDYNTVEDTGSDLSQSEIPENFRKEYGLPDTYKTIADVLKGYKERATLTGQQSNEVGDLRQKYSQLEQAYSQIMNRVNQVQSGLGGKSKEEQDAEFLNILTSDPRKGIRSEAEMLFKEQMTPLQQQIQEMRDWQQKMEISSEKSEFIRANNISPEDEQALAEIIGNDQEFYRSLPSVSHVLKAARLELHGLRGDMAAKNNSEAQAQQEVVKKKAQVLSTTNSRPARNGGAESLEEVRAKLMENLPYQ